MLDALQLEQAVIMCQKRSCQKSQQLLCPAEPAVG